MSFAVICDRCDKRGPETDQMHEAITAALGEGWLFHPHGQGCEQCRVFDESGPTPTDEPPGEGYGWWVENYPPSRRAWLITPGGQRVAEMTLARARGIAAALNTPEGHAAFMAARLGG